MTAAIVLGAIVAVLAACLLDTGGDWEGTAASGFLFVVAVGVVGGGRPSRNRCAAGASAKGLGW